MNSLSLENTLGTGSENSHTAGRSATGSLPPNDDFTIPAWDFSGSNLRECSGFQKG